jgi:hypothetical protein
MASRIKQNRLVIQLARECLENKGFRIIERYQDRGTYSRTYTIAERGGSVYLIATTGREEIRADGKLNPEYNLVQNSNDQERARRLENNKHPDKASFNFPLNTRESPLSIDRNGPYPYCWPINVRPGSVLSKKLENACELRADQQRRLCRP